MGFDKVSNAVISTFREVLVQVTECIGQSSIPKFFGTVAGGDDVERADRGYLPGTCDIRD